MEPLGIVIYGYDRKGAEKILSSSAAAAGREVIMFSASNREDVKISDILNGEPGHYFEEKEQGFVMFLGFDRELVQVALKQFPGADTVKRPIFCGLTETNSSWTVAYLMEHLIEEKNYWDKRDT